MSVMELVTLASLIERETPKPEERPLVAGVFYNRLQRDVPLQCDPTVQYALLLAGHPKPNVRPEDLRVDSPYNTYQHRGLPPGAIANPGEASLRAAVVPAQTDYLYFVANDQGGHSFSRTLEEHNQNVARLRHLLESDPPHSDSPFRENPPLRPIVINHSDGVPESHSTKKSLILAAAKELDQPCFTPAEIEQIRRKLIVRFGESGKTSADYIVGVLEEAGLRVIVSARSDTQGKYEEEFADLLHFSTLEEAEICLIRLDELLRKFLADAEAPAAERVREVARLGRRRSRNDRPEP